ncbi:Exosome complex component RRP40 [Holothuria leucospilota]|uniref:Exosome complex component RRP40 n=1 Tax=Holothuria leucospilota TaxID=206669 RepID=A0A9Q1C145_HOLLE|nr:Exosome complex component RRP40 [Holothuria leucospilota]
MAASTECTTVLPGDILTDRVNRSGSKKYKLGPGLTVQSEDVVACKCGVLKSKENSTFWIDNHQKRYIPAKGENVIGIVTLRAGDIFRVDIGSNLPASLSYLSFEGATKRNRPNVQIGDLVYAKLLVANRDMDPELVCIDSSGQSNGLGVLSTEGFMFRCSLHLCRKLLSPECSLLRVLGKKIPLEVTIGMNGRIWLRCRSVSETIGAMNTILAAEYTSDENIPSMVEKIMSAMAGY